VDVIVDAVTGEEVAAPAPVGRALADGSGRLADGTWYEKKSGIEYGKVRYICWNYINSSWVWSSSSSCSWYEKKSSIEYDRVGCLYARLHSQQLGLQLEQKRQMLLPQAPDAAATGGSADGKLGCVRSCWLAVAAKRKVQLQNSSHRSCMR
jgi:hypothetical protein